MVETTSLHNDTFLRAARCEPTSRVPIWLMRQAGRYLPEYCATRARAGSFLELIRNKELATEVVLQPLERYGLDAAIVFSDILVLPDAMGLGLAFSAGEGPYFNHPCNDERSIAALRAPEMADVNYVFDALKSTRMALANSVPLIGFSGSPFTLACYMIDGKGSKSDKEPFMATRLMMYQRPDLFNRVLEINTQAVITYLKAQVEAGAQALMVFDTWGGLLAYDAYVRYSLAPMQKIITALKEVYPDIPLIFFSKGSTALSERVALGAEVMAVDYTVSLAHAIQTIGTKTVALQGNIDPLVLLSNEQMVTSAVDHAISQIRSAKGNLNGWIFNLGHGINKNSKTELVSVLCNRIKSVA